MRLATLVVALIVAAPAAAQTPTGASVASSPTDAVAFRRIFAPTDRKQDWPFRPERYLPISAEEFEATIAATQGVSTPPPESAVAEVRLFADFDGPDRLSGQAELTIRPATTERQLVPLSDAALVLTDAVWRETKRPAIVGTTADGATAVWVEQPGTLVGRWSLRGKADAAGGVVFDLTAPAAPTSALVLTLPIDREAQFDGATLVAESATDGKSRTLTIRPLGERRRVRIVAAPATRAALRPAALRQDVDYDYSERGIDVTAQFRIDALAEPLRRLEIELDGGVTVVDARLAEQRLIWSDVETEKPAPRRIALEFDPPLFGAGRTVLLRALAPAQVGKRQLLPSIRCPDLDWRQGTMSLAVSSPLAVERIDPTSCAAATPTPLAGERPGEAIEFTCFDPQASVRVLVSPIRERMEATSVAAISFGDEELTAEYRVELRVSAGERFLVQAAVPTRWLVDAVTSVPAGAVSDWTLSEVRDQHRFLTIRPAQALRPDRPLRLSIAVRSPRPPSGAILKADDLRILEFRDARDDAPTAAVRSSEAFRLELEQERDETSPSVERLDPLRRELLGEFPADFLVDLRGSAEPWRVRIARRATRVEARIDVTATAAAGMLTERYHVVLKNLDDTPLDRVSLRFQPSRPTPLLWTPTGNRRNRIESRRVASNEATSKDAAGVWELGFHMPVVESIEFEAVRRTPLADVNEISLAGIVDAEAQQGTVTVETDAASPLTIDHTALTPLAADESPEYAGVVRGRFQYEPEQDVAPEVPTRLILRRAAEAIAGPNALVWQARLHTTYQTSGRADHVDELRVQSFGAAGFRRRFPDEARHIVVEVDGAPIEVRSTTVDVPLPPQSEFVTVTSSYELDAAAGGPLRLVSGGRLNVDVPVFLVSRTVEVPPDFELLPAHDAAVGPGLIGRRLLRLVAPLLSAKYADAAGGQPRRTAALDETRREATPAPWQPPTDRVNRGTATEREADWSVRRETTAAVCFVSFALGAVLTFRYWLSRRGAFWFAVGTTAAAATLLPAAAAQVPVWMFLGICLAATVNVVLPDAERRRRRTSGNGENRDSSAVGSTARRALATLWLVTATTPYAEGEARGQTPVAASPSAAPADAVPAVFIPVGDDGRPTGERYLVPERLWQTLQTRILERNPTSQHAALLTAAEYALTVAHDARHARYVVVQVDAIWTVEALREATDVVVPFSPFAEAATAVLVDGRPIDVVRTADGRRLRIFLERAGRHRIEAVARSTVEGAAGGSGFTLAVPRVLDAEVRLTVPPELTGLGVAEGLGAPHFSDDRRTATVRTAPSDVLTVLWNDSPTAASGPEIEQYELWRIRPGTVTVDVKLRPVTSSPLGRELTLSADPRLQWLPRRTAPGDVLDVAAAPSVVEQALVGQRLKLTLPENMPPATTVEASFLLSGATGVGRMRLPELRVEGATVKRRLFAVAVDPTLEHAFGGSTGFVAAAIPEFERVWGASASLPQGAFERRGPTDDWSLTLRPKPTRFEAAETETLTCGLRRIDVGYEATVAATGDAVVRHEIVVPAAVEIEAVSVVDADAEEQVARWSRDDAGAVIVFLRSPVRGEHRVTLRGRLTTPDEGDLPLPFLHLRGSAGGERRLRIVRLPETTTKLTAVKQLEAETVTTASEAGRGRLDGLFRVGGASPSAKLQIRENVPRVAARVVATLRREATNWEHELVAQIDVQAGLLDEIRLDLPASIATPLTVVPAMPYEVTLLRDGRRRLVLHPREALKGPFQFALRSGLTALDREHPVPHVRLRQVDTAEYYFQLPARSGLNRVDWELEQMIAVEPPGGFARPTTEEIVTFRAVGPRPAAVLRDVRRGVGRPYVRLADHRVRSTIDGEQGVTTLLIEPSGTSEFALQMPAGTEPLRVRAGGADVVLTLEQPGRYRVPAASEQLPHVLEIVYRRVGTTVRSGDGHTFAAPELDGLPITRSLWTVETDDDAAVAAAAETPEASEADVARARLEAYAAVLAELSVDGGLGVVGDWAAPLAERRRAAQLDVERFTTTPAAGVAAPIPVVESSPIDERFQLDQVWEAAGLPQAHRRYAAVDGGSASFSLKPRWGTAASAALHLAAPCMCILSALSAFWWARNDGLYRWSQPLCAVLGITWITFLQPAAVGWVLLATAVATRLHPSLRKAREHRPASPGALRLAR